DQVGLVLIVPAATQRDVLHGGQSSQGVGPDVMELQECALSASLSVLADEGAPTTIAAPHRALDVARNVARSNGVPDLIRPGADTTSALRFRGRRELRLLDLLEEQAQGALDDGTGVRKPPGRANEAEGRGAILRGVGTGGRGSGWSHAQKCGSKTSEVKNNSHRPL